MKNCIIALLLILLFVGVSNAVVIAEDDFNRADSTDLGPKWYEESDWYDINNSKLRFVTSNSQDAVINQNVSLSQGNYDIEFTYFDLNESGETSRIMIEFYVQSYTSDASGCLIQLREDSNEALAYWPNMEYIGSSGNIGISLNNNTHYKFSIIGDNVSIYQNTTYIGYLESWSDTYSNGTVAFKSLYGDNGIAIDGFSVEAITGIPDITSYGPTVTLWPEVYDSQEFNVTVNQSTACYWYVNGSLVETDSTPSTEHSYTNTSLIGGGCNVTAFINNTNGNDSQSWTFEVGADSIDYIVSYISPFARAKIKEITITRIGRNVSEWGIYLNHTFSGWKYSFKFINGTEIMNRTAASNNESLWFNGTSLLPTGGYYIDAPAADTGAESFVNPSFVASGAATILFVAAAGRFGRSAINSWRNRRRKRRN